MLKLETYVSDLYRPDVELDDTDLLKPSEADALEQGEWLVLNSGGKYERVGASSVKLAHQMWTQKGDTAAQALGKVALLKLHEYIVETDMFADQPTNGAFAVGSYVTVALKSVGGVNRAVFDTPLQGSDYVYGVVEKLAADNGGLLKVHKLPPFWWET